MRTRFLGGVLITDDDSLVGVKGGVKKDTVWHNRCLVVMGQTACVLCDGRGVPGTPNGHSVPDCQGGNPVPGMPDTMVPGPPVTTVAGAVRRAW